MEILDMGVIKVSKKQNRTQNQANKKAGYDQMNKKDQSYQDFDHQNSQKQNYSHKLIRIINLLNDLLLKPVRFSLGKIIIFEIGILHNDDEQNKINIGDQ